MPRRLRVARLPARSSSAGRDAFGKEFILPRRPAILTEATAGWKCAKEWIDQDDGRVDEGKLRTLFGDSSITAVDCAAASRYDAEEGRVEMTLREFLALEEREKRYLKDWHFAREHGDEWYEVPEAFASDWMDEWWRGQMGRGEEW